VISNSIKLIIVRGLPGSGKSTLAKYLENELNFNHLETDMFFIEDDVYKYDRSRIVEAHNWCYSSTRDLILSGQKVVVSNTFCTNQELERYLDLLSSEQILVIRMCNMYNNVHNVPTEVIESMTSRFEDYQGEILYPKPS